MTKQAALALLALPLALPVSSCTDDEPLPVHGRVPELALTDQLGRPFTGDDLRGKVSVVDFIFTSCPTICPLLSSELSEIADRYEEDGDVQLVSISVDPEHDTPEVLRAYGASYGADPERWRFVTGDAREISRVVVQGFHQALGEPVPRDDGRYDIAHSSRYVLIDREGQLRGYYRNDAEGRARLVEDVDRLRSER
jgi:protein SCO1/2